jgi:hypothetical protein
MSRIALATSAPMVILHPFQEIMPLDKNEKTTQDHGEAT